MTAELKKTVFFIGFMGAGKTTVARKLARRCNCECVDVDFFIERMSGRKIKDIFATDGEEAFRKMEAEALRKIAEHDAPRFVSCGGGTVKNAEAPQILRSNGVVIHLLSDAKQSANRISDLSTRPLFKDVENAQRVFEERLPLYEKTANWTIDTTGKYSKRVANEVYSLLVRKNIIEDK